MEFLYSLAALLIVIFVGSLSDDKSEYFLTLTIFLVAAGVLMGYFLEESVIYGLLFLLGLVVERIYVSYKWQVTRRPKSAYYKPTDDWLMKIIATLIIIFAMDMVSDVHLTYSFLAFFLGTVVSWLARRKLEPPKGGRFG